MIADDVLVGVKYEPKNSVWSHCCTLYQIRDQNLCTPTLTEKSKNYKVGQQAKFANVYDFMETMSLVDDDDLTSGQGGCHDEFWKLVQVFRKQHGKKVLFDQNYHQRQDDIRHLGRHTGYLPRLSAFFCTVGARKYAVNCAANRTVSASVTQVDTILGNDERTRKNSYVRKQDLRRNIPNNQFQVGVTDQDVQALLDGKEPCQPAFLFKGFFQKEFKLMDEIPLPAVAAFLESQLEHITEMELTFGCYVVGCGNKFSNIQELVSHTRNECKFRTSTTGLTTRCPFCQSDGYKTLKYVRKNDDHTLCDRLQQHLRKTCKNAIHWDPQYFCDQIRVQKGKVTGRFPCGLCGQPLSTAFSRNRHQASCGQNKKRKHVQSMTNKSPYTAPTKCK